MKDSFSTAYYLNQFYWSTFFGFELSLALQIHFVKEIVTFKIGTFFCSFDFFRTCESVQDLGFNSTNTCFADSFRFKKQIFIFSIFFLQLFSDNFNLTLLYFLEDLNSIVAKVDDINAAFGRDCDATRSIKLTGFETLWPELFDENASACEHLKLKIGILRIF